MLTLDLFESITPQIGLEVFNQLIKCVEKNQPADILIGTEVKPVTIQEARYLLGNYRKIAQQDKAAGLEFLGDVNRIEQCLEDIDSKMIDESPEAFANADRYAEEANYQVRETDRSNMPIGSPKNFATHEQAVAYGKEQRALNPNHKFAVYRVAFSMSSSGVPDYNSTNENQLNTEIYSVAIENVKTGGRRNVEIRCDGESPEAKAMEYLQANETIRSITPKEGVLDGVDEAAETQLDLSRGVIPSEPLPEGWSERSLAQRTGGPQTPYAVYIDGKQWKEFPTDDQARAVARKLEAKFKADGSNKRVSYSPAQSYLKKDVEESVGVTDYNPPSQGGTRKELLARYAKTGSSKDAEAARRAGASQMELKAAHPGKSVEESVYGSDEKLADVSKIDTKTLQSMHALHKHYGQKNPRNKASAERAAAELLKRGIRVTEGGVDNLEARRIDDLNMKMLDLLDRAKEPAYKKNPRALAALKAQFQKVKAERDSYFKINPATGMDPTGLIGTTKGKLDEAYQAQYKTKAEAIAYAKQRVQEFRDSLDGIEIWQLPTGFDVVNTMNANGRNHVVANGGKKLGTVYQQKSTVSETTDWKEYERRVAALEKRGLSRSDAQGVVDAEMMQSKVKEGRDGVFHASNPKIDLYNKKTREYLGSTNFYQTVFTAIQAYVQKHPELEGLVVGKKDVKESTDQKRAHQYNLDAAQREMDRRSAEGEDMSTARIDPKTYKIVKESDQKKNNSVRRNFVAKNIKQSGQGKHRDEKRSQKSGEVKHRRDSIPMDEAAELEQIEENLRNWFKEKWVRFGPDGKIKGDCARGKDSEGKPKCLPQKKAHSLGKKGRESAARRKRREDPNPDRKGAAKNVATKKKKANEEQLDEKCWKGYHKEGNKELFGKTVPNCVKNESTGDERLDEKGKGLWANIRAKQKRIKSGSGERMRKPGSKGAPSDADLKSIRASSNEDIDEACWDTHKQVGMKNKGGRQVPNCVPRESITEGIPFNQCPGCGGSIVHESELTEKKDACYHKVKSRYKVWPSAYASGALVKCRKVGAKNWGNSTKKESVDEEWSEKYKTSINCSDPRGFSQKAHCAGKKKNEDVSEGSEDDVASTILRRILVSHRDVLSRHSADDVLDAAREEAMLSDNGDIDELTAKTINTLDHEMDSEFGLAEGDYNAPNTDKEIKSKAWHTNYYGGLDEDVEAEDKLKPGEYYIWKVFFDSGTSTKVKVTTDDFDAKKFYADRGKTVVNVDYDWTIHSGK